MSLASGDHLHAHPRQVVRHESRTHALLGGLASQICFLSLLIQFSAMRTINLTAELHTSVGQIQKIQGYVNLW